MWHDGNNSNYKWQWNVPNQCFPKSPQHLLFKTMWPPMDALLPLVISSFITCVVLERNLLACFLKSSLPASRMHYMLLSFWIVFAKRNLMTMKPRSYSCILFIKTISRNFLPWSLRFWYWQLGRSPKAITMLIHPRKMIAVTTTTTPLVTPKLLSLFVIVVAIIHLPPTHLSVVQMINLAITLAVVNNMIPVCQVSTTPMVSGKTPTQLNGLIVKCIIPPPVLKLPRILMQCTRLPTQQVLAQLLIQLASILICHHIAIVILMPPIMLKIVDIHLSNVAAPIATCHSCSSSCSHNCHQDYHCRQHSSGSCHNSHFVGHHDIPSNTTHLDNNTKQHKVCL